MVQKCTILNTSDLSGVLTVNCFHLYQKKKSKVTGFGRFIKVSTRDVLFKYKKFRKRKFKSIVILLKYKFKKPDGSNVFFFKNTCILLKRRVIAVSNFVVGCCIYNLKRKKFLTSFKKVI
jgi:ribosomal protein L14